MDRHPASRFPPEGTRQPRLPRQTSQPSSMDRTTGIKYESLPQQDQNGQAKNGYRKVDEYEDVGKEWDKSGEGWGDSWDDKKDENGVEVDRWANCGNSAGNGPSSGRIAGIPVDRIMGFFGKGRQQEPRVEPLRQ